MSTMQALREKRAQIVADMEAVLDMAASEDRDLNQEETELFEAYQADIATVDKKIERRDFVDGQRAALDRVEPARTSAQGAGEAGRVAPEAKREFGSLGEFMGAVVSHYRGGRDDPRLSWDDNAGLQAADGQNMGDGAAGGFLVPAQFRADILRVDPQEAIIEARSNLMEAGTPPDAAITMPALDQTGDSPDNVYGGVEMSWIGEGSEKPETSASYREIELRPHELAGHVPFTDKLLRSAPVMSQQIETLMRQALIAFKERAFLRGDGVAKPLGILEAGATYRVNRAVANQVSYEDLTSMCARLHMDGQPYWMLSQSVMPQILQLQDPNGGYVWQPNARDGSPGTLFGYPAYWHQRSPQLGVYGDVALVSTNPYYMIKPGSGPFVAMGYAGDDFIQNRTRIKCFLNVDAQPWLTAPFTQEGGYEVSPFVALDVPS